MDVVDGHCGAATQTTSRASAGQSSWARIAKPQQASYPEANWDILSTYWFPVARLEDIGAEPVRARLLDVDLVVYRTSQGLRVTRNRCPHRGAPLSMGWVAADQIVCPYHGLHFSPDGRCSLIPSQPQVPPSDRFRIAMLPTAERYGLLWTCLNSEDGVPDIPSFEEWASPSFQQIVCPPVSMAAAPARQLEGFIDVAHFAWIHHQAFADRENSAVPSYRTRPTDYGFRSEYLSSVSNYPNALKHLEPEGFVWRRTFDVHPPFVALLRVNFPEGGVLRIMNIASPVSARETRLFVPLVRNFDITGDVAEVYAFNAQIFAEDQAIVEAQQPMDLPLDLDEEAHFAADKSSIAYRRALRNLGLV
jgi:vanillate O-demethylase monooxygenase subunit